MKAASRYAWIFVLGLFIYSCKKQDLSSKSSGTGNNSGNGADYGVNQSLMLSLMNQVRQTGCTCGSTAMPPVPSLAWNDQLASAAYNHSVEMATNNYFSHTDLKGLSAGDRITAAGYIWSSYGENIALGYTTEQAVMDGWLGSEGHCKNIMGKDFKDVGVGRSGNYWTMDLGSK